MVKKTRWIITVIIAIAVISGSDDESSENIETSEGWIWDEESNDWIEDPNYGS